MEFRSLSAYEAANLELGPQVQVDAPYTWFERKGVDFQQQTDDLDECRFGAFTLNGAVIGLLRYTHYSPEKTSLLLPLRDLSPGTIQGVVDDVARFFSIPKTYFHWNVDQQEPVYVADAEHAS